MKTLTLFVSETGQEVLVNSEDPDECKVAFYQGLHCLLRQIWSSETVIVYHFIEIVTSSLVKTNMHYSILIVLIRMHMEKSIRMKRFKQLDRSCLSSNTDIIVISIYVHKK